MGIVDKILDANPTINGANLALSYIEDRINKIISAIYLNIDFENKLLGATLSKVFAFKIKDVVEYKDGVYYIQTKSLKIKAAGVTNSTSNELAKYSELTTFLDNYLKTNNTFDFPVKKNIVTTNALSLSELYTSENVIKKGSPVNAYDVLTKMLGELTPKSYINQTYFYNNFYTKKIIHKDFSLKITDTEEYSDEDGASPEIKNVTIQDSTIKEVVLDYSIEEIEGSGCKLSDFNETQAAIEPVEGVYDIFVKVTAPQDMTIVVNGQSFSYSPALPDDTPDIVADTLGGDISGSIDGVDYSIESGYYSATPEDDDGEYKLAWYAEDTESDKSYSVSLTTDNSDEHDLIVDWDEDNGTLTVTYASDGEDTLYPTIGELIDAVNGEDTPIKVLLADPNYTEDDDYPYTMDFDLEQFDSKLILTSSNGSLDISTSQDFFEIQTEQDYVDGKHQEGNVEVVSFRRGYKYYIKIDETEYDVDTTDDNNPDVTNAAALASKFSSVISGDSNAVVDVTASSNKVLIIAKDYEEHSIETSGEIDYVEPIEREISVRNDVKDFVSQGEEVTIYKQEATPLSKAKRQTPITIKEINTYINDEHLFATKDVSSNLFLNKLSFEFDDNLIKMQNVYEAIKEIQAINPNLFPNTKFEYISIYDDYIDCKLHAPDFASIEKYYILKASDNSFISKTQLEFFDYLDLESLQTSFLNLGEETFSKELDAFSDYLNKGVVSLKDLKAKKNSPIIENAIAMIKVDPITPLIKTPPAFVYGDTNTEAIKKYTKLSEIISRNDGNLLSELIDLFSATKYSVEDIRWLLEFDVMRDVVLEMDVEEELPTESDGLTGTDASGEIGFKDLYIREYKKIYKEEFIDTSLSNYFNIDINSLSDFIKTLFCLPPTQTGYGEGVSAYFSSYSVKKSNIFRLNPYDLIIYRDIIRNAYFPRNLDVFKDKVGNGRISNGNSIWNVLIKAISFQDEETITYVGDAWSTLKMLFAKFETYTDWEVALMLAPFFNYAGSEVKVEQSAIHILFAKIYSYIKQNGIESDSYEDTFNKLVGLLFTGDNSKTGILPYSLFQVFVENFENNGFVVASSEGQILELKHLISGTPINIFIGDETDGQTYVFNIVGNTLKLVKSSDS